MNDELTLPSHVLHLLLVVAGALGEAGLPLTVQARRARVTAYSPTYIDLEVPSSCDAGHWADGPLDVKPLVTDEEGEPVGEVLVWVSGGRVTLLEQAWFTDDPPTTWPAIERVSVS